MVVRLDAVCFAADDPGRLAAFWSGLLGWPVAAGAAAGAGAGADQIGRPPELTPTDDRGIRLRFRPATGPRSARNHGHPDLTCSSPADQRATVARALRLGARHLDIGQGPDVPHVVLADPEGNEFCVIEPGNGFLADCGVLGAMACDGSQQVGYFWSAALGWPLVWDRDEETAIQSPGGGSKISWGGPPLTPGTESSRVSFELVADGGRDTEVDRLLTLGAQRVGAAGAPTSQGPVALADLDGRRFTVLTPG